MGEQMTGQQRSEQPRHGEGNWVLTAAAAPLCPLLFWAGTHLDTVWHGCLDRHGSTVTPTQGPCASSYVRMAFAVFCFWVLALMLAATGLIVGIVEGRGRGRCRFAHARW